MTYNLYLDDERNPTTNRNWVIARTFAEAVVIIEEKGYPMFVSFDHDLGDNIPTGYDFAKWLIERDLDTGDMPKDFNYNVHSANPPGAANIRGTLSNYTCFTSRNKENK